MHKKITTPSAKMALSNTQLLKKGTKPNAETRIRKRHWFAGTLIILTGSWITHTTTASIASPTQQQNLSQISVSSIDESMLNAPQALIETAKTKDIGIEVLENDIAISSLDSAQPNKPIVDNFKRESHKVKKGESLGIIFRKKGYDLGVPYKISQHPVAKRLVSLSVGKELTFAFDDSNTLRQIAYPTSPLEKLVIEFEDKEIVNAVVNELKYETKEYDVSASIESSLFLSAQNAGLSHNLILEMVRIFGWDIDFVLDIRSGDSFHIIYTEHQKDGKKLKDGDILAAEFTTQGRRYRAIRFEDENNNVSYYTPEGESMLGTFLRSPVKFSRISSRFGKRKHPISKKWKAHKGTDYAASRGTPILATADGKVTKAGRNGGYGKTVVIRHAGRFSTLYAHMNGFAKGIRSGSRVKQGDVIGYVGSTGYSTGPHLHYEFRVDGVHRNSLTYKTPKASSISAESKSAFNAMSANLTARLDSIEKEYMLAQATQTDDGESSTL